MEWTTALLLLVLVSKGVTQVTNTEASTTTSGKVSSEVASEATAASPTPTPTPEPSCVESEEVRLDIASYQGVVNDIIEAVLHGDFKGKLYEETAEFVDTVGPRLVGSKGLEEGIEYMIELMKEFGLDNVHKEEVLTPKWSRGHETLMMMKPRHEHFRILGYGSSVGTGPEGLEAEVVVVSSYEELEELGEEVTGKIVVYDHEFHKYSVSKEFRNTGAVKAAEMGAVAALVAALSNVAMDLPHTGQMRYSTKVAKIPLASISIDTARMLGRIYRRNETVVLKLSMGAENQEKIISHNIFGDLTGTDKPEEAVLVSGHIDSWDVGQGAQDDGAAVVMSAMALSVLKDLNMTTRRTLRAIGWTSEENGLYGAKSWLEDHKEEIEQGKIAAAIESDTGLFAPLGFDFSGTDKAGCVVQEILKLFKNYNFTAFSHQNSVGSDVALLVERNVPVLSFKTANEKYFWYHHAESDTMAALDSDELDACLAMYTAFAYVVADMKEKLPVVLPTPSTTVSPKATTVHGGRSKGRKGNGGQTSCVVSGWLIVVALTLKLWWY